MISVERARDLVAGYESGAIVPRLYTNTGVSYYISFNAMEKRRECVFLVGMDDCHGLDLLLNSSGFRWEQRRGRFGGDEQLDEYRVFW